QSIVLEGEQPFGNGGPAARAPGNRGPCRPVRAPAVDVEGKPGGRSEASGPPGVAVDPYAVGTLEGFHAGTAATLTSRSKYGRHFTSPADRVVIGAQFRTFPALVMSGRRRPGSSTG